MEHNISRSTDVLDISRKVYVRSIYVLCLGNDVFSPEIFRMLLMSISEGYWEPCLTSKVERRAKLVHGEKSLTIFAKCSIIDI